jgi:Galactosyltransferase
LAIVNCHSREEYSAAIRNTWLPSTPSELDVRFFRGRGATREPLADEVFLDCRDDYEGLPNKVQEIVRWAHDHEYEYVAKVDDDVVVRPKEWLYGFHRCDFTGCREAACKPNEIQTPYGFFYVLNRKTMELVMNAPLPTHGNDEAWVSTVLYTNGIFLSHDARYYLHRGDQPKSNIRPLRAPRRDRPLGIGPVPDAFAWCVYLNWNGFHQTPQDILMKEYHCLYERYAK